MKKHLLFIATLFPFWAANAQTSVSVTPVSANYTAATPTVTFEVSWPAGSRNASERAKVWLFVDYRRVQNNAYAGGWLRAGITDPPVLCTAGTPTLAPGNDKGFWLQGPDNGLAFAATVTVPVTVDLSGYDPKFGWCAYATDLPPYAEAVPGGYSLRGTEPFIIQTIPGDAGSTVTQSATTFHGCMYGLTDATGCPGELPPMPAITGFTASAATLCAGQSATLTATAAGAELYSFDDGATWQPGATKAVTPTATTTYILKVSRTLGACTVSSPNTVTVTVLPALTGLSLTASPATVCAGQSSTLTASAAGAAEYSLNGANWQPANTFNVTPTATTNYTLYVRSAAGCTVTLANAAAVTVNNPPAAPNAPAQNGPQCEGTGVTFSATLPAGAEGLNWEGTGISGSGLTKTSASTAGTYQARVQAYVTAGTNTCYSAWSNYTSGTVIATPGKPAAPTTNGTQCSGTGVIFTTATVANATGYEWSGFTSGSGTSMTSGTASGTYQARTRAYTTAGTQACPGAWSDYTSATVSEPFTQGDPSPATICYNKQTGLTAAAATGGKGNLSYTWQQSTDNNNWATAPAPYGGLTFSTPLLTAGRYFRRAATNDCGTIYSNSVFVTVRPDFSAGAIATTGQTICAGDAAAAITGTTAASGGDGTITYQWEHNGADISGATLANYTPAGTCTTAGVHTFTRWAHDGTCNTGWVQSTGQYVLTVIAPGKPAAPTQDGPQCEGVVVTFTTATVAGATGYEWSGFTSGSGTSKNTGNFAGGTYQARTRAYTTVNGVTCHGAWSDYTTGIVIALPGVPTLTHNGPTCEGTGITFTATPPPDATDIEWYNDVSGTGLTKTSGTAQGNYSTRARVYTAVGGKTCYGEYSTPVTGTVIAKPILTLTSGNNAQTVTVNTPISKIVYNIGNLTSLALHHDTFPGLNVNHVGSAVELIGSPSTAGTHVYGVEVRNEACTVTASGTITVLAPQTPPSAGTKTYTCGAQTWSEPLRIAACDKTSFNSSNTSPDCRSNTYNSIKYFYYNWAYVNANKNTMCPDPWRVPTNSEFSTLLGCLGTSSTNGKYYPESSTWGGARAGYAYGSSMTNVGSYGYYWSSTEYDTSNAYYVYFNTSSAYTNYTSKTYGFQVRCVK